MVNTDMVEKVLNKKIKSYVCKSKYVNVNYTEVIYDLKLINNVNDVVDAVKEINGIEIVNIVQSNTETMG